MTPEAQRIAIAEACGWTWNKHAHGTTLRRPDGSVENHNYAESHRLPDYLGDLNSMHEAISTLPSDGSWGQFNRHLANRCGVTYPGTSADTFLLINATATQRAEAFLRTIGKWTE